MPIGKNTVKLLRGQEDRLVRVADIPVVRVDKIAAGGQRLGCQNHRLLAVYVIPQLQIVGTIILRQAVACPFFHSRHEGKGNLLLPELALIIYVCLRHIH